VTTCRKENRVIPAWPRRLALQPLNVPALTGADAVSMNVLDEPLFSPKSTKSVPKAVMRVTPPDVVPSPGRGRTRRNPWCGR
jgi:hypothetical protein